MSLGYSRIDGYVDDKSPLYRALHISALVSESGRMSVTAGKMDNATRRMMFEHVGQVMVFDWVHLHDSDFLAMAAAINQSEAHSGRW